MPLLEPAIVYLLQASHCVASQVGSAIYPNKAPRDSGYPYIVYHRQGTEHVLAMDGPHGTGNVTLELECSATTYEQAKAIADSIVALDGFAGRIYGALVRIQGVFLEDESDEYTPPAHADDTGVHTVNLTLNVWS